MAEKGGKGAKDSDGTKDADEKDKKKRRKASRRGSGKVKKDDGAAAAAADEEAPVVKEGKQNRYVKASDRINIANEVVPGTAFIRNVPIGVRPFIVKEALEKFGRWSTPTSLSALNPPLCAWRRGARARMCVCVCVCVCTCIAAAEAWFVFCAAS